MSTTIEQSIDVAVPVGVAYNQWTQFTEFPRFMEGVDQVEQVNDTRTHWKTSIAGVKREFDAEITEQLPDERIAWTSTGEPRQAGVVTFHHLAPQQTRVMLQMEFVPEGAVEKAGAATHLVERRIKGDLKRFKEFIEAKGGETGGWRGEVGQNPTA
ncbi:SRPBCC family protein [Spirillospora sp. NPDC047279]|uniref:SRPBCC family protein n=1 Tax=Spirillospora sp. NPDC047279 TaxID=3155478 RepID=UPI0033DA180A